MSSGATLCKKENLKEMNDVSSGMASTIIQLYLKDVLESFLHPSSSVRQAALGVIQLILSQGLVHPVQVCNLCAFKIFQGIRTALLNAYSFTHFNSRL